MDRERVLSRLVVTSRREVGFLSTACVCVGDRVGDYMSLEIGEGDVV